MPICGIYSCRKRAQALCELFGNSVHKTYVRLARPSRRGLAFAASLNDEDTYLMKFNENLRLNRRPRLWLEQALIWPQATGALYLGAPLSIKSASSQEISRPRSFLAERLRRKSSRMRRPSAVHPPARRAIAAP